jgi:hypothetical protein
MTAAGTLAQEVLSNANDRFLSVPDNRSIDLGATIELDEKGYPTPASFQTLYDELDYQGAVSAYLQTLPQMNLYGSLKTNHYYGAVAPTDSLLLYKDPGVDGMLTPNRVVKYLFNYPNLAETGPMIYEMPAGEAAGLILDFQMRWERDLGVTSPYAGRPVKYLVLTRDQELPKDVNRDFIEYDIVRLRTNHVFFAFRVLNPERDANLAEQLKIYPYAERASPKPNKFFQPQPGDDTYYMAQPVGMAYWEQLHEYLQIERVEDADRYMLARLKAVGIEIGKPFDPTTRQIAILEKAALVGEKMALVISFAARSDGAKYRDDTRWVHPLTLTPSHRDGPIYQIEERVDWTFEAYGISQAMKAGQPGEGSTYLAAYTDDEGKWLEGENSYVFRVAPNAPAARFWDLSIYKSETRGLLPDTPGAASAVNTFTKGLKVNKDGSIDIYFGPDKAPEGYENNFVKTYTGVRWFTYFRLYGPTETYFDRSWPMDDIKNTSSG